MHIKLPLSQVETGWVDWLGTPSNPGMPDHTFPTRKNPSTCEATERMVYTDPPTKK